MSSKKSSQPIVARLKAKVEFTDGNFTTRYSFDRHYSYHHRATIKDESIGWEKLKTMIEKWGDKVVEAVFYLSLEDTPKTADSKHDTFFGGYDLEKGFTTDIRFGFSEGLVNIHKFK